MSRRNSPKQFTPLIASQSSIQLAVERLTRLMEPSAIYVGTNQAYARILHQQLPAIPPENYILEPTRRDVAAAVALAFFTLERDGRRGPVVFQWSDHYVNRPESLLRLFTAGTSLVESGAARFVIVAQEPSFANEHLGWIKLRGEAGKDAASGEPFHAFGEWVYRPDAASCAQMFASREWVWNTGHFVTSVEFMTSQYRSRAPRLAEQIEEMVSFRGTAQARAKLKRLYPQVESHNFDDLILMGIPRDEAFVLKADLGWKDPGNLNALKEALQETQASADDTVTQGNVVCLRSKDVFVHNATKRPVAVMGASNLIVVEMADVTLVIDKGSVRDLGVLLAELERRGHRKLL